MAAIENVALRVEVSERNGAIIGMRNKMLVLELIRFPEQANMLAAAVSD